MLATGPKGWSIRVGLWVLQRYRYLVGRAKFKAPAVSTEFKAISPHREMVVLSFLRWVRFIELQKALSFGRLYTTNPTGR